MTAETKEQDAGLSEAEIMAAQVTKEQLLTRMLPYVKSEAKRKKVPEWSIVGHIFGHGSGVSSALFENYIKRVEK